jgi:hypothetical protein
MQISPRFAVIAAAPFALFCAGFALNGFLSLGDIADPQEMDAARGFIGFWLFLAAIAVASGAGCWWLMKEQKKRGESGNA